MVHKITYILSCLSLVFWNLTKAYNFKGEARLRFCVQRGQLNYCGWRCSGRLVKLILCFNLQVPQESSIKDIPVGEWRSCGQLVEGAE